MILPADKGRATVILNKEEYQNKVKTMLEDEKIYARLEKDPTPTYERKLVAHLARLKKEKKITETQKRHLYPTSENVPRLYCTPKIHKEGNPLRPIVDYTGSIAYNLSRSLADVLSPLVGKTQYHVENSKSLMNDIKDLKLEDDETLVSFDVVSLFTNTPIDVTLQIIKERLENDTKLKDRTNLTPEDIIELLHFVLTTTYFKFNGEIYRQKFGTAMGSPVSPIVANLFMEYIEPTAIATHT